MKDWRGVARRSALAAAGLIVLILPAPAGAQAERDCYWQGGGGTVNAAYPDLGARYWVSAIALAPGTELTLRGRFPHARYFSFNAYDAAAQPVDALADVQIVPDEGSTNPFLPGARRDLPDRDYVVRVVAGPRPATREANTLYLGGGTGTVAGTLIYRVYVPDAGRDVSGDVGPPAASMDLPSGQTLRSPIRCTSRESAAGSAANELHAGTSGAGADPANPTAEDPVRWEAFFNYAQALTYPAGATPLADARAVIPRDRLGGFLSNVDNAYTFALSSRGIGPVLVLTGRAPTTPRTRGGAVVMDADVQLRYWSICQNELASQRVIDCLYDEQLVTDANGRFTVVVSTPNDRPATATTACGVNWLAWGAQPDGFVILRHMLPSPDFAQAIQNVDRPGVERDVMGEYLPDGHHTTPAQFDSRGCGAG